MVNAAIGYNVAKDAPNILLAGGGTGGHLFPALAIADEIKRLEPSSRFLFLGTKGKIEARVVPERGYPFRTIWISGFHRRLRLDNFLFPIKVIVSFIQSLFVIRQFRPDVVVGTGGYVCGPILFAASLLGIPTIIHESNSYPGVTTRLLAKRVTTVFIAFDAARRWLKRTDHVMLVGTPTREKLGTISRDQGRTFFHIAAGKRTLLIFGGSLGAASINDAVLESLQELLAADIQLVWQTGQSDYDRVRRAVGDRNIGWLGPFIDKMEYAFGAADLVVCRAGATTLAELALVGKPAVLVPYPFAAGDHQTHNARSLADGGAAVMIADQDARQGLKEILLKLLNDPRRLDQMSKASAQLGKPLAGREIAAAILGMIR
ncbi:MAG: UDP-N-acetylglucosamine--N-acetylmuramyl-(pentapeptide) pyrophosphoryl-undecaprenol [Bacteroidetes bacterium]|nr:UDP-N-acetylglucosamine--N-acetylmuramyl-(pentapeptide) pyrophosphoryl-undecaprenol [Bacteroidota bacterium]